MKSYAYLTACLALCFAGGYLMGHYRYIPLAKTKINLFLLYRDRTIVEYNTAIATLYNCDYMRRMHHPAYSALLRAQPIAFGYEDTDPLAETAYAFALPPERMIVLTPNFFAEAEAMRVSILAHESLHIFGLPDHLVKGNGDVDTSRDPIYTTVSKCFPGY